MFVCLYVMMGTIKIYLNALNADCYREVILMSIIIMMVVLKGWCMVLGEKGFF